MSEQELEGGKVGGCTTWPGMTKEEALAAQEELTQFLDEWTAKYPCGIYMSVALPVTNGADIRTQARCNGPLSLGLSAVKATAEKQGQVMIGFIKDALSGQVDEEERADLEKTLALLEAVEGMAGEAARG